MTKPLSSLPRPAIRKKDFPSSERTASPLGPLTKPEPEKKGQGGSRQMSRHRELSPVGLVASLRSVTACKPHVYSYPREQCCWKHSDRGWTPVKETWEHEVYLVFRASCKDSGPRSGLAFCEGQSVRVSLA